jgi:hypothetical protein
MKNHNRYKIFRMEFPRPFVRQLSFSSSEGSFLLFRNNSTFVLNDPTLNIDMPTYVITDQMTEVTFAKNDVTRANIISLRRGLCFLKALAQVTNPGITEWHNVLNIIRVSLKELRLHTEQCLNSTSRWENIGIYLKRSRRVISWVKVMKNLGLLANEIPEIESHAKSLFEQLEKLMLGTTRFAAEDKIKWEEDMLTIPRI